MIFVLHKRKGRKSHLLIFGSSDKKKCNFCVGLSLLQEVKDSDDRIASQFSLWVEKHCTIQHLKREKYACFKITRWFLCEMHLILIW